MRVALDGRSDLLRSAVPDRLKSLQAGEHTCHLPARWEPSRDGSVSLHRRHTDAVAADTKIYAYSFFRMRSTLFLVEGVR